MHKLLKFVQRTAVYLDVRSRRVTEDSVSKLYISNKLLRLQTGIGAAVNRRLLQHIKSLCDYIV
jgi:hypothetical protein